MNPYIKNIAIVSIIVLGFGGLSFYLNQTDNTNSEPAIQDSTQTEVTQNEPAAKTPDSTPIASTAGTYQEYSEPALLTSDAEHKVLFFHASWCPTCNAANRDIENSLADIPENVAIFKTDYDVELELRQTHGVTLQHSFVLLDSDQATAKRWTNSRTLEDILAEL